MIVVKIMNKIVIFGSGNHAKVIFSEVIKLKKFKFIGFVDDLKKNPRNFCFEGLNFLSFLVGWNYILFKQFNYY